MVISHAASIGALVLMPVLLAAQHPNSNQNRSLNYAIRQQQDWQRRQLPVNSSLYKIQYGQYRYASDYHTEFANQRSMQTMAFNAPAFSAVPGGMPAMPDEKDKYTAAFNRPALYYHQDGSFGDAFLPIPDHHLLLLKRSLFAPLGYR
jgi:hypothetical protein